MGIKLYLKIASLLLSAPILILMLTLNRELFLDCFKGIFIVVLLGYPVVTFTTWVLSGR